MENKYTSSKLNGMLDKLEKDKYINIQETIELGLKVYSASSEENYEKGMAFALLCIGRVYLNLSKYEEAMIYLFDSIKLSDKNDMCDLQLLAYINIGNIYFDIEQDEKSLEYYNSAEKIAKTFDNSENHYKNRCVESYIAIIYNNIGEIYRILKCYEDAISYYNLSVNIESKLNYQATFGMVLTNLGHIQYQLGNYESALEYLNKSIFFLLEYDYKIGIAEAYGILALIYEKKSKYLECEKYFLKALDTLSDIDYIYSRIDLLLDFSSFLDHIEKRSEAIAKLDEVYSISIKNKLYAKTMEICKRAIALYERANDTYNANRYYKYHFENEEKLESIKLKNRVRSLKTKIQLDSLEEENKRILEKSEILRRKADDLKEIIKNISIIGELGEKITTTLELGHIYEMLHHTIQNFMYANDFGIALYNDKKRTIEYQYLIENNVRNDMHEVSFNNEASLAVKCLKENRIIVINDMNNEYLNYVDTLNYSTSNKENYELKSAIYCPLTIDNNLIGVITAQAYKKNSFTMIAVEMMKALSSYAAIAINNAIKSKNLIVEVEQRRKVQIQLQDTNKKLVYLSENDGLTGIPNRRKFDSFILEEWNKAKENKSIISIIIFDIDCFKQYNDNYGHIYGDSCLIKISKELSKSLVKGYFAARYGGDEFVIVLPHTSLNEAKRYGENFRLNVQKLSLVHKFSKVSDIVTVTLGVSSAIPSNESTIIEFIREADFALYEAKNKGRNQIVHFNFK
ncbi:sensor domain-containing diguanylate cyclase [Clostridium psychrophilum]|uniref:sensor domain-containing diguanylate cyclase n=1 Tax=Clostridium psychrophilum TaxID=132926 RepID=UPI001C0BFB1C|nr:diguanylate cyclase [Clostridium psychrophilum]MBU3182411.1 diguanylate cyclase [Clostridium psychrophilum]